MTKAPTRHHTVPVFYLRNFAHQNEQVAVFNKLTNAGYVTKLINVCVEKNFYRPTGEIVFSLQDGTNAVVSGGAIEDRLMAKTESVFSPLLKNFIKHVRNKRNILPVHKSDLAFHIAMQWFRSSGFRDQLQSVPERLTARIQAKMSSDEQEIQEPLKSQLEAFRQLGERSVAKEHHLRALLDSGLWRVYSAAVAERSWCILENNTNIPFYTSDTPVIIVPRKKGMFINGHITSLGTELLYPLTPKLLLLAFSEDMPLGRYENKVIKATRQEVINYNYNQYLGCKMHLIVSQPDYSIAKSFGSHLWKNQ